MASVIAIVSMIVTALVLSNAALSDMKQEALAQQQSNLRAKQILVGNTVSSATIQDLQNQVTSIDEVLNLIDAIADQTNLLALNAANERHFYH
ncbi:MAG: methyl-accepting chemotaxis protein [Cyclobacteriaceae bacterium]|jgi:methyl-accepting chemotaxis protein